MIFLISKIISNLVFNIFCFFLNWFSNFFNEYIKHCKDLRPDVIIPLFIKSHSQASSLKT